MGEATRRAAPGDVADRRQWLDGRTCPSVASLRARAATRQSARGSVRLRHEVDARLPRARYAARRRCARARVRASPRLVRRHAHRGVPARIQPSLGGARFVVRRHRRRPERWLGSRGSRVGRAGNGPLAPQQPPTAVAQPARRRSGLRTARRRHGRGRAPRRQVAPRRLARGSRGLGAGDRRSAEWD
jgi:hypothetical protein